MDHNYAELIERSKSYHWNTEEMPNQMQLQQSHDHIIT